MPDDVVDDWPVNTDDRLADLRFPFRPHGPTLKTWVLTLAFNLPVCLLFGSGCTNNAGRYGMAVGILALFGVGWGWIRLSRPLALDLIIGGSMVAVTQGLPYLQIMAGAFGLKVADRVVPHGPIFATRPNDVGFTGAVIATVMTGGLLMTLAEILGLFSRLVTPTHWRYGPKALPIKDKRLPPDDLRDFA